MITSSYRCQLSCDPRLSGRGRDSCGAPDVCLQTRGYTKNKRASNWGKEMRENKEIENVCQMNTLKAATHITSGHKVWTGAHGNSPAATVSFLRKTQSEVAEPPSVGDLKYGRHAPSRLAGPPHQNTRRARHSGRLVYQKRLAGRIEDVPPLPTWSQGFSVDG